MAKVKRAQTLSPMALAYSPFADFGGGGFRGGGGFVPTLQAVASRGLMGTTVSSAPSSSAVKAICRTSHYFCGVDVTEVRFVFVGYKVVSGNAPTNLGNQQVVSVGLEMVSPLQTVVATFSAAGTGTVTDGLSELVSDPILPSQFSLSVFPKNTKFWVRHEIEVPASGSSYLINSSTGGGEAGEGFLDAPTGEASLVGDTGVLAATGNWVTTRTRRFCPVAIIGKTTSAVIAIAALGDSIVAFQNDIYGDGTTGVGGGGFINRGLGNGVNSNRMAYSVLATPGAQATQLTAGDKRLALLKYFTHLFWNYGTNDGAIAGRTSAQCLADLASIASLARAVGGPRHIEQLLLLPRVTTTDAYATLVNQTPVSGFETGGAFRDPVNTGITSGIAGIDSSLDLNSKVADGTSLDKWTVTGAANYATSDGTHPAANPGGLGTLGHAGMATAFATRVGTWS